MKNNLTDTRGFTSCVRIYPDNQINHDGITYIQESKKLFIFSDKYGLTTIDYKHIPVEYWEEITQATCCTHTQTGNIYNVFMGDVRNKGGKTYIVTKRGK